MRKKSFLKMVSLFACFSILMLSVPGVITAEKPVRKNDSMVTKYAAKIAILLSFLNLQTNVDKASTSSDQTSNDGSGKKIKITGTLTSPKLADNDN